MAAIVTVQGVKFNGNERITFDFRRDELVRPETTLEGLGALKPAFSMTGSVTAGGEAVEPIRCEVTDRVAVVTIDRTARRNALNLAALSRLDDAVASAVADGAAAVDV